MKPYVFPLRVQHITSAAWSWGSRNPDFVLNEELLDWLAEMDFQYRISYTGGRAEDDYIEHFIEFDCHYQATHFKIRWI